MKERRETMERRIQRTVESKIRDKEGRNKRKIKQAHSL